MDGGFERECNSDLDGGFERERVFRTVEAFQIERERERVCLGRWLG